MQNLVSPAFIIAKICAFTQTQDGQPYGHGLINSVSDPDQEYIYFVESGTPHYACYIHLYKVSIPFFDQWSIIEGYQNYLSDAC